MVNYMHFKKHNYFEIQSDSSSVDYMHRFKKEMVLIDFFVFEKKEKKKKRLTIYFFKFAHLFLRRLLVVFFVKK